MGEPSNKRVAIGIVGLGRLGRRHAENLAFRVPGARLVAAASPVAEERDWAKARLGSVEVYESLSGLLRAARPDAIWLVTPTSLHAEQIVEALEAGADVFCEKPLSLETAGCDLVLEASARRPNQLVSIGFNRRFDGAILEAAALARGGALGEIYHLHFESHDPMDPGGFFVKFAATSGGIFLDCTIHDIDLCRWIMGRDTAIRVTATGGTRLYPELRSSEDMDAAAATVSFASGAFATFHTSRNSMRGYESTLTVRGSKGGVVVGRDVSKTPLVREAGGGRSVVGLADFFGRFEESFVAEAGAFVSAVQNRTAPPVTLADAREATRWGCAMRRAAELAMPVAL